MVQHYRDTDIKKDRYTKGKTEERRRRKKEDRKTDERTKGQKGIHGER